MSDSMRYNTDGIKGFLSEEDITSVLPDLEKAHSYITQKNGPGNEFLGWEDLPERIGEDLLKDIEDTAEHVRSISDYLIVIGIGGSYLGAKAALAMLRPDFDINKRVYFAGYHLTGDNLHALLDKIKDKDICVNIISKSGTTTEPAIAARIIEGFMRDKYGEDGLKDRIICTTDKEKGALRQIAVNKGYKTFVIPDDVGGRFSVLTPVGLFPIACSGINIREMIAGAKDQMGATRECDIDKNISYRYATVRNALYRKGKRIELLASFDSKLHYLDEWWRQLFGESEGKGGHSIFPSSCNFSTDLHSMGQLIQEGERNLFETFLVCESGTQSCTIPEDPENLDNLNYLAGKTLSEVNFKAFEATKEAHLEGGVPSSTIFIPEKSAYFLGQLFYFFEKAVAASAYMFGVNPFNQPGVEAYKNKMFKLLGKPGV